MVPCRGPKPLLGGKCGLKSEWLLDVWAERLRVFCSCPLITPKRRPLVVANARHGPSYGCALRLDRTPFDALLGHARKLSASDSFGFLGNRSAPNARCSAPTTHLCAGFAFRPLAMATTARNELADDLPLFHGSRCAMLATVWMRHSLQVGSEKGCAPGGSEDPATCASAGVSAKGRLPGVVLYSHSRPVTEFRHGQLSRQSQGWAVPPAA